MSASRRRLPSVLRGLSARLLILTIFFVMVSEVLIYVPSISRFRLTYLQERIAAAHLASLALKATPDNMVNEELEAELLVTAKVRGIVIKRPERRTLMLSGDMPPEVAATYDVREMHPPTLIRDAFETMAMGERMIRVLGPIPDGAEGYMDIVLDERLLHDAMVAYSINILQLSIIISLLTASLVFLALHILMVRPMRQITASMTAFRKAPEDQRSMIPDSARSDEIGTAQRELRHMQDEVRAALRQRAHLAALGSAVGKINHDLRNMLATAQIVSDSLATVEDPHIRRIGNRLMIAVDRAIDLCTRTLTYGRAEESVPRRQQFALRELADEVAGSIDLGQDDGIAWINEIDAALCVNADREQIFRILMNLGRNAAQAMSGGGEIRLRAVRQDSAVTVDMSDTGPGLPEQALEHLFEPFTGSARAGGTGLGLAIARELAEAHGGSLDLVESGPDGTTFRLVLPDIQS